MFELHAEATKILTQHQITLLQHININININIHASVILHSLFFSKKIEKLQV